MDFFQICTKEPKRGGTTEVYPDFTVGRSQDLMVRGQSFYAIWDAERGLWSTDEYDVQRLVDQAVIEHTDKMIADGIACSAKLLQSFGTNGWKQFRTFLRNVSDNSHQLDTKLTFANTEVKKSDYVSRRLPYDLASGSRSAYEELITTLYAPEERAKFEWAIGSVISGDSKKIQKFLVFYGPPGSGKGTVLDIMQRMFVGYTTTFEAKALVGGNNNFATEMFKDNPLVAIQGDGDLSRIEDNTKLNSIVSHEDMTMNEKYKPQHTARINAMLFMGTNKPVKISDAKSGLIRRLIDVVPTGNKVEVNRYNTLMSQTDFELGAIAHHCLEVYREMGKNYYNSYRPLAMMLQTDVFFNYIEAYYDVFKAQNSVTLKQAYALYKEYCEESELEYKLAMHKFREELKNYFEDFHDRLSINGTIMRSYYTGFTAQPFKVAITQDAKVFSLVLDETESLLDEMYATRPAQYGKSNETPRKYWTDEERLIDGVMQAPRPEQIVDTVLADLNTSELHFLKVPENHIVIDFDLKDGDGKKSLERNLEASSEWPATYAELSKSGGGVHLHYLYDGASEELASQYSDGIEIKTFPGNSALRRKLTKCNNVTVATISSGLPFKEKKPVLEKQTIQSEKGLRDLIARNLRKEIHGSTKPSMDFIQKILDDAYVAGIPYDVSDMRPKIMAFANNSSNKSLECLKVVTKLRLKSEGSESSAPVGDSPIVIFDVEVYPNLFVICWSYEDSDVIVRMINPTSQEVEGLFQYKLVGFFNRDYDNHILWGAFLGYNNLELYQLSKRLTSGDRNAKFGEAYNLSYADIYDFSSIKQGLKKFMIQLGLYKVEMDLPWDEPVDPKDWPKVVEYCANDVAGTKVVLKDRAQDFVARQILAELSGLSINDTTQKHTARIIFGKDRKPQDFFNYTDLSEEFPGYIYDGFETKNEVSTTDENGVVNKVYAKSTYRDEVVGEGGYVHAEPGMYKNVALLDVASMHPTSIVQLDLFGKYTNKFADLLTARLCIKRRDYDTARQMLDGKLAPFLEDENQAKALSDALKIVINIVYGLTSAKFDNPFRDLRNVDNIVAKRGALFMVDLKHAVQAQGFQVVHIKTDSIKIPNATPEIIEFVKIFGDKYGYTFEHEGTYDKFLLVNDAVYVARKDGKWEATGAQFKHPVVFKALFSGDPIKFEDLCETKQVRSPWAMYLDFGQNEISPKSPHEGHHFIGKIGMFLPVYGTAVGAKLVKKKEGQDTYHAVSGTKNHMWLEADMVKALNLSAIDRLLFEDLTQTIGPGSLTDVVDMGYYETLVYNATKAVEDFGDYLEFIK